MLGYILLLPCLLYLNPEIGLEGNLITKNCFIFNGGTTIRSCNRVYHNAIPTDLEIYEIKAFFADLPFSWFVDATDTESIKVLEQNGMHYKASFPAMVLDITTVCSYDYGIDIAVKEINLSDPDLKKWITIVSGSFIAPESELIKVINLFKQKIKPGALKLYLGYYKGKTVAASMMIQHNEIVSLHWISTLSQLRNKGLGFAVTHKALLDAKAIGCKQAILLSSALGKPIYEHLGFKEYALYKVYGN